MAKEKQNKIEREKQLQLTSEREVVIQQALLFSKKRFKKFDEIILQLYRNEDLSFSFSDRRIWKINECFNTFSSKAKSAERKKLKDVFIHLNNTTELLNAEEDIQAVYNIVLFRPYWTKDFFDWKPYSKHANQQIKELAAYLFCKYKVPDFLYQCFYETKSTQFIYWLIHIGTGGKVKEMTNIPIPFTQKMGHYFLQAPDKLTITEALRWAQVKGLGGDDRLAERICYSWISTKPYSHEDFWEAFIQLLANGGMFNINKTTELIDYVREAKRENERYSLKGRTLKSLLRQSDVWHQRFSHTKINQVWKPCGIEGYRAEKKSEIVMLEELTESRQLTAEGKTMKHCVGSYAFYCAKGKSAIFSLRKYSGGVLLDIIATIEVSIPSQRVVQAKAKMNKPISDEARKYMETWATKEGLAISPYL
jgi:PcfJ-like protein